MTLSVLTSSNFMTSEDITIMVQNAALRDDVTLHGSCYATINVNEAASELKRAGDFILLAHAASCGYKASVPVAKVLTGYQRLVTDTLIATNGFVSDCLESLQNYRTALVYAEKGRLEESKIMISDCGELAKAMAEKTRDLAKSTRLLTEKVDSAVHETVDEHSKWSIEAREIDRKINEYTVDKVQLEAEIKRLETSIDECAGNEGLFNTVSQYFPFAAPFIKSGIRYANFGGLMDKLEEMDKKLETLRTEKNEKVAMLESRNIENPQKTGEEIDKISNEIKEIEDRYGKEFNVLEMFTNIIKQMAENRERQKGLKEELVAKCRVADLKLAETIERMRQLSSNETNAALLAKESLGLTKQNLLCISSTFDKMALFWESVGKKWENVGTRSGKALKFATESSKDIYVEQIRVTAIHWLVLGQINVKAQERMQNVHKHVGEIMLKDIKEGDLDLIKELSGKLKLELEGERKGLAIDAAK